MRPVDPTLAHRLFYPGVPAILSVAWRRTVAAMPVISYASLSDKPPLFGVSCRRESFTLRMAVAARAFSLCILEAGRADSVALLASRQGKQGMDKLAEVGLKHTAGRRTGAPILSGSAAALELSLLRSARLGDHVLLIGKIEAASASPDFRGYWRFKGYIPMLYTGWQQGGLSTYHPR